ncbi:MAG TPA: single-stranded DNA-binding protein [Flavobacteriaceae bacterium]|nr:single-stranded DNA-binding protein [Flavobacteriaceae bacterium]
MIGHVGNDPEVQNLESGSKLVKLRLATNESYRNKEGERVTQTEWHNVVAWNKTAEIIENYVTKGKEIGVNGRLTTRTWEDKDGNKRYFTEVVCNEVLLLGGK